MPWLLAGVAALLVLVLVAVANSPRNRAWREIRRRRGASRLRGPE